MIIPIGCVEGVAISLNGSLQAMVCQQRQIPDLGLILLSIGSNDTSCGISACSLSPSPTYLINSRIYQIMSTWWSKVMIGPRSQSEQKLRWQ